MVGPIDPGPRLAFEESDDPVHPRQVFALVLQDRREVFVGRGVVGPPEGIVPNEPCDGSTHPREERLEVVECLPDRWAISAGERQGAISMPQPVVGDGPEPQHVPQLGAMSPPVDLIGCPAERQGGLGQPLAEHPLPARDIDYRSIGRQLKQRRLDQDLIEQHQEGHQHEHHEVTH